jgi:hypothetical protein
VNGSFQTTYRRTRDQFQVDGWRAGQKIVTGDVTLPPTEGRRGGGLIEFRQPAAIDEIKISGFIAQDREWRTLASISLPSRLNGKSPPPNLSQFPSG